MSELRVYQSKSGNWIFWDGTTKHFFNTEMEALIMSQKVAFVTEVQILSEQLASITRTVRDLRDVYADREYAAGGDDPIIDSDIESTGTTVAELNASIVMFLQLLNFTDDNPVTQGNYGKTVNDMRTDV